MQTKIKDINEFCKLYKINIPIKEDFDYYIATLLKSPEYKAEAIEKKLKDFAQLERIAQDNNFESVSKLKMYCLDTLADYIKATSAYEALQEKEMPKKQLNTKDWTSTVDPSDLLMSIDFKSANYSVLKTFDNANELKESWRALCESLLIPEALIESKSFRQLVFGNTSPKRLQVFQHLNMILLKEALELYGTRDEEFGFLADENSYVFVSHDEIIIKIPNKNAAEKIESFLNLLSKEPNIMATKATYFSLKKIKKNLYVKTVFELSAEGIVKKYDTLHGAPGNKFYMLFKEYILCESYNDRDLVYMNDGELSRWAVEKPKGLPHYPKPKIVLSIEESANQYPWVWDKMSELVPNLTNEEKRRIIEIVANTCKSCWKMEIGCNCDMYE
jgi:hypothetical protein